MPLRDVETKGYILIGTNTTRTERAFQSIGQSIVFFSIGQRGSACAFDTLIVQVRREISSRSAPVYISGNSSRLSKPRLYGMVTCWKVQISETIADA